MINFKQLTLQMLYVYSICGVLMITENTDAKNDNVIVFPGARFEPSNNNIQNATPNNDRQGLTDLEWEELEKQNLVFSDGPDKNQDLAYELAFKKQVNFDITNLYYRPRFAKDFDMPGELQSAFQKLEIQFNQWDYLIRKIAYYKRS